MLPGTAGLTLAEVAHILVPGHGRNHDGAGLNPGGADRCRTAHTLHDHLAGGPTARAGVTARAGLSARAGLIVCAGYKSPVDGKGAAWTSPEAPGETFRGVPEADLMRSYLVAAGTDPAVIRVERHSVDTVTNLLRAEHEGHFGDDSPVAIVSHRAHLHRILTVIAPRTLRRPYLGVVVPDTPTDPSVSGLRPTGENLLAAPISRLISAFLPTDPAAAIAKATHRSERLWRTAQLLGKRSYH